jgi:hypothetical protein
MDGMAHISDSVVGVPCDQQLQKLCQIMTAPCQSGSVASDPFVEIPQAVITRALQLLFAVTAAMAAEPMPK